VKPQLAKAQGGALRPAQSSVVQPLAMFGARQLARLQAQRLAPWLVRPSRKIKLHVTVRRRLEAFHMRAGPEHRAFTTVLTPGASTIFGEFRLAD